MDRKEFIRITGRWIILSLLVVSGIELILKRKILSGKACNISYPCGQCRSLSSCNLQEAVKFRQNEKEKKL